MATHTDGTNFPTAEKTNLNGNRASADFATADPHVAQRRPYDYGGNPLAHMATNDPSLSLPAFGGSFQPGLYRAPKSRLANPAPLGLSAFALTTFVLSLINLQTRGVTESNIVVGLALAYGGLVQLLAGMWEIAAGNTFGATALSSYGGFWIAFGFTLTPGFGIVTALGGAKAAHFNDSMGYFLMGWFIFTFILLLCTLRSTVAFFFLFFTLDMAFLLLAIGHLARNADGTLNISCIKGGGGFGMLAAFLAWYNALAGIADSTNSFFVIPVAHFPWSEKGRERRNKVDNSTARNDQSV
ncbi:hypothetical protein EJ06DRAFT_527781 [Trichodelitschia bisporula]|uniref:Uncharacterized protein n=1 Tax=Trichodelitschia bisporula TaxID=703511 RepID=A0A6G1I3P0_9PEZI|nr:hypothetical protein EJ06DRAFT_527781 [Trichodelitschia bisporula]